MTPVPWASATVLIPLAAALICGLLSPKWTPRAAIVGAVATVGAVAGLVWRVGVEGQVREAPGGWGAPVGIELYVDGFGALMVAMAAVVGMAVTVYSLGYFRGAAHEGGTRHHEGYFWSLWLVVWSSLNGIFISGDLFNLYVALEVMGLGSVALVALAGPKALRAAMRYLLVTLVGSMLYLLGVALLYGGWGVVDIHLLSQMVDSRTASQVALGSMTLGLALKTALVPLHFWLPTAHANAPAPVSAVLSGLVVKASLFVLITLWVDVFAGLDIELASVLLAAVGALAMVWGSIQALRQSRLKMLVAYSTVAQLGVMFIAFAPGAVPAGADLAWAGAAYFIAVHGCAKGAMFLAAGAVARAAGTDRFPMIAGRGRQLWAPMVGFIIGGVVLIGIPGTGGYAAKSLLGDALYDVELIWLYMVLQAGTVLTALYIGKVVFVMFIRGGGAEQEHEPVPVTMTSMAIILAMVAVALGPLSGWALSVVELV